MIGVLPQSIGDAGQVPVGKCHRPSDGLRVAVVREHCITALDVAEFFQHGLGGHGVAAGAEVPLKIADPKDQLGDRRGARIQFDAEELVRVNAVRGEV